MGYDMDPSGNLLLQLLLIVVLIMINSFFAASEIAIITLNDKKVKRMAEDGDKKAVALLKLTAHPTNFLATIQVGVTLTGLLASAIAAQAFSKRIVDYFKSLNIPSSYDSLINGISIIIITLLLSYVTLVFGELVPKRIGMQRAEKTAMSVIGFLSFLSVVIHPFVTLLAFSANLVMKLLGFDPNAETHSVTEEEIRMLVDAGEERGVIEESEKNMINNIFEFDDRSASEIMTHRTEVVAVPVNMPFPQVLKLAISEGNSRIPIFEDDLDTILGVLYVKDLLKYVGYEIPEGFNLKSIMRNAYFVPETKKCSELFEELTYQKVHMAVVVDEYGGTAGIITIEDLLESIVGNIQDEYDNEEQEISRIDDSTFSIEGTTSIDEVSRLLEVDLPEGDYDTLGGFIIDNLGRIPDEEEHPVVEIDGYTLLVEQIEDRRIVKVKATKNPEMT
jgi:putative hemolysin